MNRLFSLLFVVLFVSSAAFAQNGPPAQADGGSMALAPARFELEMAPGSETTVVLNLDYRSAGDNTKPARIAASLNDWSISPNGQVDYYPANSRPDSASSWMLYSPGEASVMPGSVHKIRVTVSVPLGAKPGDHLAALIVEQRPNGQKHETANAKQMIVRYRMASVFYIKVSKLTRKGNFENLIAEWTTEGVKVTPVLKNEGNSVIRPVASLTVVDRNGEPIVELADSETLPILGGAEIARSMLIEKALKPGTYKVKYRVDFRDGNPLTEGVTDFVVESPLQIASEKSPGPKRP